MMRPLIACLICTISLAVSATRHESQLMSSTEHKITKREENLCNHRRDSSKIFGYSGKLYPLKQDLKDAKIENDGETSRSMKSHSQKRNFQGFMQLVPSNQYNWNFGPRNHKSMVPYDERNRNRYSNSRAPLQRPKAEEDGVKGSGTWFFPESSVSIPKISSRKLVSRHSHNYQNFPPYWQSGSNRHSFNPFPRVQRPRAMYHRPKGNNIVNFVKKDCNACNSIPWIPILKPSAVHDSFDDSHSYGVPTIEVHHDSKAYSSSNQQTVSPSFLSSASASPSPVIDNPPDSTIPESYGLPAGNIPTDHGLLPPINPVKISPPDLNPPSQNILNPRPANGLFQAIPFPELSSIPVVPLHDSNQFLHVSLDTQDLVPPVPPRKSAPNVIFTISEHDSDHKGGLINNHIGNTNQIHGVLPISGEDQHFESSSLINAHFIPQVPGFNGGFGNQAGRVNLDIVKSVPLVEYTSSIEYPLQIIQSPPYIDIAPLPNATRPKFETYEKEPQTGDKKISDIILGLVEDSSSKKSLGSQTDNESSGSKILQHPSQELIKTQQSTDNHFLPTVLPQVFSGHDDKIAESEQIYYSSHTPNDNKYTSTLINTNILHPGHISPNSYWSSVKPAQFSNGNPTTFIQPLPPPHQPKVESVEAGTFTNPTSASWLVPAQSNMVPQWILPVNKPPSVSFPLIPEEGIASIVNGELSPTPSPPSLKESKSKKIQIIIPYTTGENKVQDQTVLDSIQTEIYKVSSQKNNSVLPTGRPFGFNLSTQHSKPNHSQGRRVIEPNDHTNLAEFSFPVNFTRSNKYLNDVHQIVALNIKELLKEEIENPKSEQNIRLQKNIDNWTALEYSNHKTVAKKEPLDVISYANAVTSIPGTSMSHLLLTSKKIPDKYLTTTPLPDFDEPVTKHFASSSVSVASKPFTTKSYDTSGLYSMVTRITPTVTFKAIRNFSSDAFVRQQSKNHRNGYGDIVKTKTNQWAKLNENLIIPEDVSKKTFNSTTTPWSLDEKVSLPTSDDHKVYVVTPVSTAGDLAKRTTRQAFMTEQPEIESEATVTEVTKSYFSKLFGNKTERQKITKFNKPKPIEKFFATTKAPVRNLTKIEIKIKENKTRNDSTERKSINDVFPFRNGGELPLELAVAHSNSEESHVHSSRVRKGLVKQVKDENNIVNRRTVEAEPPTEEPTTVEIPQPSTSSSTSVQLQQGNNANGENVSGFGLKIENNRNSKNISRDFSITETSNRENQSVLPPGIFGETKRIHVTRKDEDSPSDLASLNETIRLLKEYLQDTSDELPQEKTDDKDKLEETDRS